MNTEHLRYILAIDQYKSINKAAKSLFITQSALSRILQNVEERIGSTIFERTNRGVEVTNSGEAFLVKIRHMLLEIDKIQNEYFSEYEEPKDTKKLVIGAHKSSPALDAFIQYYNDYCKNGKYINLVFLEKSTDEILQEVSKSNLKIGIIHYLSSKEDEILQSCNDYNLSCNLIDEGKLNAQIRKKHPLATRKEIFIKELKPYTQVVFEDESISEVNVCSNISKFNWQYQGKRIITNSRGDLRSILAYTDGYYLGNSVPQMMLKAQDTVSIPVADYPYTIKTAYVHHNGIEMTEDERIYINCLVELYEKKDMEENKELKK